MRTTRRRRFHIRPTDEALEGRLLLAGSLDTAFGVAGKAIVAFDLGGGLFDMASAVAVQSNGKIVVGGQAQVSDDGDYDYAATRLGTDGKLNVTFGTGGKAVIAFNIGGRKADRARAVAIQPDGKILVVGEAQVSDEGDIAVARLDSTGMLDTEFGTVRKTTVAFNLGGGNGDFANAVAIQPDGKIVLAGNVETSSSVDFAVARLLPDGSLDSAFGNGGKVSTDYGSDSSDSLQAIALQADGTIVVGGSTGETVSPNVLDAALLRYTSDDMLDTTFGTGGKVAMHTIGDTNEFVSGLAIRSDGAILAAGSQLGKIGLIQFTPAGTLDQSFNRSGSATFNTGNASSVTLQKDGKIVLAGFAGDEASTGPIVLRLNADGTPDASFGTDGRATAPANFNGYASLAIGDDGDIVTVGTEATGDSTDIAVTQLIGIEAIVTPKTKKRRE